MFAQQVVNGIMLGSVYALIGVGYTLVFGVLGMLNLAHAYIFAAGPFVSLMAMSAGVPAVIALPLGIAGTGFLGVALYFVSFRPIPKDHALSGFVTSLSFGVILQVALANRFGTLKTPFATGLSLPDIRIGDVILSGIQAMCLGITLVLMVGLLVLIERTRFGRRVRAIANNETAAALLGIPARRSVVYVFALSSALAGLAGILVALRFEAISPFMSDTYALKALAVIVIGGLGDIRGTVVAGLLLGISEVLLYAYAPPILSEALVWVLLIAILVVRPGGLAGRSLQRREI